jgi:hypothetical protein
MGKRHVKDRRLEVPIDAEMERKIAELRRFAFVNPSEVCRQRLSQLYDEMIARKEKVEA